MVNSLECTSSSLGATSLWPASLPKAIEYQLKNQSSIVTDPGCGNKSCHVTIGWKQTSVQILCLMSDRTWSQQHINPATHILALSTSAFIFNGFNSTAHICWSLTTEDWKEIYLFICYHWLAVSVLVLIIFSQSAQGCAPQLWFSNQNWGRK